MKTTKQIGLVLLAIASGLWLSANASRAQVTDTSGVSGANTSALAQTDSEVAEQSSAESGDATIAAPEDSEPSPRIQRGAVVVFGRNVELKADEQAEAVVVFGRSAIIHGQVKDAAVAIGGNLEVDGNVGDAVVAILGRVTIKQGANVRGDVVAVGGKVTVEAGATVRGDVVAVGGTAVVAKGAKVKGQVNEVDVGIPGLPRLEGLSIWFQQCVLKLRPLAPQVGWVWIVAGVFALVYFLVALAFPRPVGACVDELTKRPATTLAIGLLTKIILPVIYLVLLMTGIGVFVIPLLQAALFVGVIVAKVSVFEYLGGAIGRLFGADLLRKPLLALALGIALITLLYMVPILGFMTYVVMSIWALGVLVTTVFSRMKRERPPRPAEPPIAALPGMPLAAAAPTAGGDASTGQGTPAAAASAAPAAPGSEPPIHPGLPAALSCPKAGFWERMGAAFLDVVLISILTAIVGATFGDHVGPAIGYLIALAYFAGLWAWKGTTVGGVVLRLQVVRHDGGPVTFLVALVRGLAAAFSAVILFLGFFWIGWDRDKQGWHDKIAGTYVVRTPRSLPLVCV